jgi:hypothetical protein
MIIIIKSKPYESEFSMGALIIALSTSEASIPSSVFFVEQGLCCLIRDQNEHNSILMPSISDLILSLIGSVKFYYIPSSNPRVGPFSDPNFEPKLSLVPGVKQTEYSFLAQSICGSDGKNLLIL